MKTSMWYSVFKGKCPVCHVGNAFETNKIYNFKKFDKMHKNCSHCGHKFEIELGFWYGAMFVSYAMTVAFSVATFVLTYLIFPKASVWLYISFIIFTVIMMVPITYRGSRLIWMNFFSKFDPQKANMK